MLIYVVLVLKILKHNITQGEMQDQFNLQEKVKATDYAN
jgi:hypothetical protein